MCVHPKVAVRLNVPAVAETGTAVFQALSAEPSALMYREVEHRPLLSEDASLDPHAQDEAGTDDPLDPNLHRESF